MSRLSHETERLRVAIDAVVPADDFPSASQAGGLRFWSRVTETERPEWSDRVIAVLDLLDRRSGGRFADLDAASRQAILDCLVEDRDYLWFSQLVTAGFYADPGNGGNDDAVSWRMLGWDPAPAGGLPAGDVWVPDRRPFIRPDQVAAHYDAVVVGSGAGGGVAAWALARSGRSVLLVERGAYPETDYLARDHLRNARTDSGLDHRTLRSSRANPRTLLLGEDSVVLPAWDPRFGSNADTYGGGTRVYGAQAWRFMPEDFAMASTYGVPENSALADWPISYDDLEPFYTQAEYEIGVCGSAEAHAGSTRRSRPYPMAPMPLTEPGRRLLAGAEALGLSTAPVPLAINSTPYHGRSACARCRQCVGFTCPIEAKNSSDNTVLVEAAATGNLSIVLGCLVRHGLAAKQGLRNLLPRMQRVVGPVHEVTTADARVRLDPTVTDSLGIPVARLSGRLHPNDLAVQHLLGERAADWLRASGAKTAIAFGAPPDTAVPSNGQHQAGTCRMGTEPASSVTDPYGRVWGHSNLRVVDGSLNVTNGGVNPVLTIFANAFRIMHTWVGSGAGTSRATAAR